MKASSLPPPTRLRRRTGFTEEDVCNYAHHLWIQSGMSFDGDPWEEARACLAAHLPAAMRIAPGVSRRRLRQAGTDAATASAA